jgi:hypothetical protein
MSVVVIVPVGDVVLTGDVTSEAKSTRISSRKSDVVICVSEVVRLCVCCVLCVMFRDPR